MKKFFFPLDTVLRYKEQVLDSLKGEHARILAKIRECENAIDELEHEYSQCAAEFQQNKMNGMKINEMHTYENYFDSLRLKIRRKQEQLARLVDVRRETIGNLESGRYNPSLVLAWNIAKVFGVPIEEIFTVED